MTGRTAVCPNCGAEITFRWSGAVQTTCPACHSVLVRHDVDLERVGSVGDVPLSMSRIQLGTEGSYEGKPFVVVGRIVYEYERGHWSEWYVRFNDATSAWLSDAQTEYAITTQVENAGTLPAAGTCTPGRQLTLLGGSYSVAVVTHALYSGVDTWNDFLPENVVTVRELMAADPAASAILCADLLSRDLTSEFRLPRRPVDDPLLYQLADPRRTRPQLNDSLWVRIVDVPRALAGRRYSCPVDVVIEVRDEILPSNAGRWRLTTTGEAPGGGLAASCVPAAAAADLALDVTELGAAYLGGTRLGTLAGSGLVAELRPGATRQLSAALAWDPAPWCPMVF